MSERIEFQIPRLPKLPNQLLHRSWRVVHRERDVWHAEMMAATAGRRPNLKRARLTLTRCSPIEPDPDNMMAGWKYLIDGLVVAGVLEDDSARHVQIDSRWEKAHRGHLGVRVVIEELDP